MKRAFVLLALAMMLAACGSAQVNLPLNGSGPSTPKKPKPTSKMLTGTVTDQTDRPISGAVVYLKNAKTLVVKSFFTQEDGSYRFPQLSLNTDYEIWAEKDGKKSATKGVSQFDDHYAPTINMSINLQK